MSDPQEPQTPTPDPLPNPEPDVPEFPDHTVPQPEDRPDKAKIHDPY